MDFIASIMSCVQTIIVAPLFLLLILITELIPPTIDTDISKYETYRQELNYADEFMPELSALSDADTIRFAYQKTEEFIGTPHTLALTATYSDDAYNAAVASFEAAYTFVDAPIIDTDGDILLDDAFSYRGFDFRSVAPSPNNMTRALISDFSAHVLSKIGSRGCIMMMLTSIALPQQMKIWMLK